MDKQNSERDTWIKLALNPIGDDEYSLAPSLLRELLDRDFLNAQTMLQDSPLPFSGSSIPYDWLESKHRRSDVPSITLPVWVHWLLKQRDKEKAAHCLLDVIEPSHWVRPFWRNARGVDILYRSDASTALDRVLSGLDKDSIDQARDVEIRSGRKGLTLVNLGLRPQMLKVLLKHGWDIDEQDANGDAALDVVRDEGVFTNLIKMGADLSRARKNVNRISSNGKVRQLLRWEIAEKEHQGRGKVLPWQREVSKIEAILESGVSGGFDKSLSKLIQEHPRAPEGGIEMMGGSIGWALLKFAAHAPKWNALATKTKSYFNLAEAVISNEEGEWIDLDAPMRGPGVPKGLTNRDGVMVGAFIMMMAKAGGSTFYPKYQPRGDLNRKLSDWACEHLTDTVAKVSGIEQLELGDLPEKILLGLTSWKNHVHTYRLFNSFLDKGVNSLIEGVDGSDKLLLAFRDSPYYGSKTAAVDEEETDLYDLFGSGNLWPVAVAQIASAMGALDEEWIRKASDQFRLAMTRSLIEGCPDEDTIKLTEALEWVIEPQYARRDKDAWNKWVENISRPLPLYMVEHYLDEADQRIARLQQLRSGDQEDLEELAREKDRPEGWEGKKMSLLEAITQPHVQVDMTREQRHQLAAVKRMVLTAKIWGKDNWQRPEKAGGNKPKL